MPRLALIITLTIAILSPARPDSPSAAGAPRFVSLAGRFSISLADHYKKLSRLIITFPSGGASGNLYEWQTKETTFGVGYADSFQPPKHPQAIKELFDSERERFRTLVAAADGDNAVVKEITIDNHPGIEQRARVSKGSFIQRTYLVSRRIYQTLVVVTNSQRDESAALGVLDSFKLLTDTEITEEALKVLPGPLPQTPEAPRAGSDAEEEGLRGAVKSVRTEVQYPSETVFTRGTPRSWLTTYNENGNMVRTDSYDSKNNLERITVFGYLDGSRVSASKYIERDYSPPVGSGAGLGGSMPSNREKDPRYQRRFEYKYDDKKRLTEKTEFLSNGEVLYRSVYKYEGNQKEGLLYENDNSPPQRSVYTLDDKGNEIEHIVFARDGSIRTKLSHVYEFDSKGSWIKRTTSRTENDEWLRRLMPPTSVHLRTITYY